MCTKLWLSVCLFYGIIAPSSSMPTSDAGKLVLDTRKFIDVLGTRMSYLDTEEHGDDVAVVFLHGNPTSAYLWRNVIPHVQGQARCLAPDLVGMGHSDKLNDTTKYRFVNHYEYLSAWMEKVDLPLKVVLVVHDWGSGLGFHWANEHRDRVLGIVFMESVVGVFPTFDSLPDELGPFMQLLRTPLGEPLILEHNLFITVVLPVGTVRNYTEEEMKEYNLPYEQPGEDRRPTLTWPRELPVKSAGPEDTVAFAESYSAWLAQSADLPKLYIKAEPGALSAFANEFTKDWPNLNTTSVKGLHYIQEDVPDEIGASISHFLYAIEK